MKSSQRSGTRGISVYSNLGAKRRTKKDLRSRRRAEYLATLPKHPVKRLFYRLHPKRFFAYWFSREGGIMALKVLGTGILLIVLLFGALFAYYRRDLAAIRPGELSSRVQTTVSRYFDRNGVLLWEDKGANNYKLVVPSNEISKYMKDATIAIEDKDFYKHGGFSIGGIVRATFNNFRGGNTQGGSTLTQQLVKQVFLADEAQNRGLGGLPRKIKETILAIEVERTYNKDQILTLYLNESPYGGRRNGVESAAQTYFGKSAKDLTLAEAALLASIPQQPGRFDPYYALADENARNALTARQHTTLDYMVDQKMVTKAQADEAKQVSIFDTVKPQSDQFKDTKAPHFVQMVKSELEAELGKATVGNGGLTVKTTLDWRVQQKVDQAMEKLFASSKPTAYGFDNGAATVVDVPTGQILGLRGSRDFYYPDYGAVNAAESFIQPGSSIKPLVFSSLFKQREGVNYGAGSILSDDNIDNLYGGQLRDFDNKFKGPMTIRSGLAESRNIPAVKAYLIDGKQNVLNTIRSMGDISYCTDGKDSQAGASLAIGGCGLRQVEHVNAFATIARMGVYKPVASILEVKNAEGQVIKKWKDEGKQVIDPQIPYIISDILSDDVARAPSYGRNAAGLVVPGVKTATKTGTSNIGDSSKDLWMMSWNPRVATGIWVGNHVPKAMKSAMSFLVGPTIDDIMLPIHQEIFAKDGSWKPGEWFTMPAGVQRVTVNGHTDLFPSWYNKNAGTSGSKIVFDRVSKKKATECTPEAAKDEQIVTKITDPITKKTSFIAPYGYDATASDDVHRCDDVKANIIAVDSRSADKKNTYTITAEIGASTHPIQSVELLVNGSVAGTLSGSGNNSSYTITSTIPKNAVVTVKVTDSALYTDSMPVNIR